MHAYTHTHTHAVTYLFAKPTLLYSQGYITPFVATSFQYCSVHPLPIILLAGSPTSAAFAKVLRQPPTSSHMAHSSLISPCITKLTCIVPPPTYASRNILRRLHMELASLLLHRSFTASPFVGARWHFRSFLPPVPYGGSPPALRTDKCAARLSFFLATGAFTGHKLWV